MSKLKVAQLRAENFKKIKAINLILNGKDLVVTGANGSGKSSAINSLWIALTGKNIPDEPIRQGQDKAVLQHTLIDEETGAKITVTRTFTLKNKTGTLKVSTEDGAAYSSPQTFLDKLIGQISFDPFELVRMKPAEMKKFFMNFLNLNFDDLDARKKETLAEQKTLKDRRTSLREQADQIPLEGAALQRKSVEEINQRMTLAMQHNNQHQNLLHQKSVAEQNRARYERNMAEIEAEIKRLQERLKTEQSSYNSANMEIETIEGVLQTFTKQDVAAIQQELATITDHNARVERQERRAALENDLTNIEGQIEIKQSQLKRIEQERADRIASVNMPVQGLEIGEDGLLFNGLPFSEDQLSTAQMIDIGVAMSIAMNPNLRIMRVNDASLLDSNTLAIIEARCQEHGYQLFTERVGDGSLTFEIEDEDPIVIPSEEAAAV